MPDGRDRFSSDKPDTRPNSVVLAETKVNLLINAIAEIIKSLGPIIEPLASNSLLVKEYCNECGMQPQWNNKFLRLQIHHVDGDRLNNELSNLMFLCPNCHTQTDTYGVAKMYRRT